MASRWSHVQTWSNPRRSARWAAARKPGQSLAWLHSAAPSFRSVIEPPSGYEIECMHSIAVMIECRQPSVFERRSSGRSPMIWTIGGDWMRTHLKLPALAIVVILVIAACSSSSSSRAPSAAGGGASAAAPSAAAPSSCRGSEAPSAAAAVPTPEPAKDCAQSKDANAMQMWERSGGNKGMVDILVCAWNAANPTKPINLSYIVHTEMVAKIAQGVASGDVPDLMGMDLIYAPQFENAGQLVDITDQSKDWPELADVSPGHKTVATFNDRLYGVPLYADVSALFYNKDLFTKAGLDPNKPPTSLAEIRDVRRQDHRARRRRQGLLPARQLRRLQHLHRRPADVGVGRHDRGRQVR